MFPIAYHPIYKHPVPENHRFPMEKYELLPQQLLFEGIVSEEHFFQPTEIDTNTVCLVHDSDYVNRYMNLQLTAKEIRKTGFIHNAQLVQRERIIAQGTLTGALKAIENSGIAFNIAGGTHHAFSNYGEGFCMLNDQAIAAAYLLKHHLVSKVLIVDLDVHQGNGTAEIFSNNPNVFTFSMHGKTNYPFKKEQSSLDIALENNTTDAEYLQLLTQHLEPIIAAEKPDFIFYQAGVDILTTDKLGKLNCSINGCKQRDILVFSLAKKYHIPIQCSMGGGYSPDLRTILQAHVNTFKAARDLLI
ncbi:histone deacetylase family protein [Paenimyroides aestuarii]|uniref:Histone deacetylase n=1 Tax=Paenimyroides aestuarii TaxID=2968490 RepID=A0ABY5NU23_9FLAO|nr:histone deacetylase [Paenimyroides aestuarii]UUV22085.1 histone deacetylase [Paenimyroides aestuarii]